MVIWFAEKGKQDIYNQINNQTLLAKSLFFIIYLLFIIIPYFHFVCFLGWGGVGNRWQFRKHNEMTLLSSFGPIYKE